MLHIIKQALSIYAWLVIGALIVFIWHIAGFYEKASGQAVGQRFLILPGLLLAGGVIWYLTQDCDFVGEPVGDVMLFAGGILLFLFAARLQKTMTGE